MSVNLSFAGLFLRLMLEIGLLRALSLLTLIKVDNPALLSFSHLLSDYAGLGGPVPWVRALNTVDNCRSGLIPAYISHKPR